MSAMIFGERPPKSCALKAQSQPVALSGGNGTLRRWDSPASDPLLFPFLFCVLAASWIVCLLISLEQQVPFALNWSLQMVSQNKAFLCRSWLCQVTAMVMGLWGAQIILRPHNMYHYLTVSYSWLMPFLWSPLSTKFKKERLKMRM